jgi:hypothetical protein
MDRHTLPAAQRRESKDEAAEVQASILDSPLVPALIVGMMLVAGLIPFFVML